MTDTVTVYLTDGMRVFVGTEEVDVFAPLPPGSTLTPPPDAPVVQLQGGAWVVLDSYPQAPSQPEPSQFDRDKARYEKRAAVKDQLLAWMAADNMSRVRTQEWTADDLRGLVADPAIKAAMDFMGTLSFELAAQAIASASTPLLTSDIRSDWITRLQAHFYLEG